MAKQEGVDDALFYVLYGLPRVIPSIHLACVYPSSIHLTCCTTRVVRRMIATFHHRFFFIVPWSTLSHFTKEDSLNPRWIDHVQGRGTRPPSSHPPSIPAPSAGGTSVGDPFCLARGGGSTDQTSWDVASVLDVLRVLRGSTAKEAVQEEREGKGRDGSGRDMHRCRR